MRKLFAFTLSFVLLLMSGFIPIDNNSLDNPTLEISEVIDVQTEFENPATVTDETVEIQTVLHYDVDIEQSEKLVRTEYVSPLLKIPDIQETRNEIIYYTNSSPPPQPIEPDFSVKANFMTEQILC